MLRFIAKRILTMLLTLLVSQDNERNFEALYNLVRANDKLTATIAGTLEAIKGDLSLIKDKLFKRTR